MGGLPLDAAFLILLAAVLGASALQSATGIGYGVIAGPIMLVVLNGTQAFQISAIHNLLIALILAPFVYRMLDRTILKLLIAGSCLGIPAGFVLYLSTGVMTLKLISAAVVSMIAVSLARSMLTEPAPANSALPRPAERIAVGLIGGLMSGILAMPGPVVSTWMSIRGWGKDAIRSTVLTFFVFAYGTTLALQLLFADVTVDTLMLSLVLSPIVVLGVGLGYIAARFVSERVFRVILLAVLIATVCSLLFSL